MSRKRYARINSSTLALLRGTSLHLRRGSLGWEEGEEEEESEEYPVDSGSVVVSSSRSKISIGTYRVPMEPVGLAVMN